MAEAVVNVELSLLRSLLVQPQTERGSFEDTLRYVLPQYVHIDSMLRRILY